MSGERPQRTPDPAVGLCSICLHARVTGNRRGSRFWLCRLSVLDAGFRRYPPLPVNDCPGFTAFEAGAGDDEKEPERSTE